MPNRIIKESICTSDNIDQLSAFQETMFYRLIVNCDDFGRFDGRPKILVAKLFPLKDIRTQQIEEALRALTSAELVILYEVDGKPFVQMKTWDRHQQIRTKKSKYPAPDSKPAASDIIRYQVISSDSNCPRNPIQSESESNPYPNPMHAHEADTPFGTIPVDDLIVKVQKELNGLTDTHYSLLAQYREQLGDELVSYAIDNAVANGVRRWAYVERILCNWQEKGVRTIGDAKAEHEKHRSPSAQTTKAVHAQQFTQRSYTDAELESDVSPLLAEALAKAKAEKARAPA